MTTTPMENGWLMAEELSLRIEEKKEVIITTVCDTFKPLNLP